MTAYRTPWDGLCRICKTFVEEDKRLPRGQRVCRKCYNLLHRISYDKHFSTKSRPRGRRWDRKCYYCGGQVQGKLKKRHNAHETCLRVVDSLRKKGMPFKAGKYTLCQSGDGEIAMKGEVFCEECLTRRIEALRRSTYERLLDRQKWEEVTSEGLDRFAPRRDLELVLEDREEGDMGTSESFDPGCEVEVKLVDSSRTSRHSLVGV